MWKSLKAIALFFASQIVFCVPVFFLSWFFELNKGNLFCIGVLLSSLAMILYFCLADKVKISSSEFNERPLPTLGLCICIVPLMQTISSLLALNLPDTLNLSLKDMQFPLALIVIGVIIPIAEEVVFRGAVLGSLLKWGKIEHKPWVAILLSALLFSLAHLNPAQVPTTLFLGLIAGWLYFRTESLIPGMVLHIVNNSAACLTLAIPEGSKVMTILNDWNPSSAIILAIGATAIIVFLLLLRWLMKVVNRDMPAKSIWSDTDPHARLDVDSARKLGICSAVLIALIALLPALKVWNMEKDDLINSFGNFHDGLAYVKTDGKIGFIDIDGNMVILCKYDRVADNGFNEGLCGVEINGLWGYIDKNGHTVIPMQYSKAGIFDDGFAWVCKDDKYGYIDKEGNVVVPFEYDGATFFKNGKAVVAVNGKYGVIDTTGKEIVPFEYEYIYSFHDGIAMVSNDGKYGFITEDGSLAVPVEYDSASFFKNGMSIVSKDGKYGIIDSNGNVIVPFEYDYLQKLDDKLFFAKSEDTNEIINIDENIIYPFKYESVLWYSDGLAIVEVEEEKSYLVNLQGAIMDHFDYSVLSGLNDGLAIVKKGDKMGFVNSKGEVVIPFIFDNAGAFSEGLAKVCKGRHRYYIDTTGKVVIKLK